MTNANYVMQGRWVVLLCLAAMANAAIVEYRIAKPQVLGSLEPRLSVHLPPSLAGIRAHDVRCFVDAEWELCGTRLLTFLVEPECVWPIRLYFDFSERDEGGVARHYEMQADVTRCNVGAGLEKCRLCATPSLTPQTLSSSEEEKNEQAHLTLLCRLWGDDALAVWSLTTTRRANSTFFNANLNAERRLITVPADHHVQTLGSRFRVSHAISAITVFGAKNKLGKTVASRDRVFCYCGYNVACGQDVGMGRRATVDDLVIHESLSFPRVDQRPFGRIHITESTLLNSVQTTAILVLLVGASLLCAFAAVYFYVTQKVTVLRDTGEANALVARVDS